MNINSQNIVDYAYFSLLLINIGVTYGIWKTEIKTMKKDIQDINKKREKDMELIGNELKSLNLKLDNHITHICEKISETSDRISKIEGKLDIGN